MKSRLTTMLRLPAAVLFLLVALPAINSRGASSAAVSFSKEIAPLLTQRCQSCHQPSKKRGGYQVHTFNALLIPGSSKEIPILPGKPEVSALLRRLKATDPDERMPQKEEALSPAEIHLIERWIAAGASFDGERKDQPFSEWAVPQTKGSAPVHYDQPFPILSAALLRSSNECLVAGYYEVLVVDRFTKSVRRRLPVPSQRTFSIQALESERRWLLAGGTPGRSGELAILDLSSTNFPELLLRTSDALLNGVLSSNGKWIAVAGADPTVRLLDPKTGQLVKAIEAHADWVTSIAFTPDSSRILTVSRDKTARCFAVPGGESISAYLENSEPFLATQCERGGAIAFAAGRDHQIHAWKMEDGKRVSVIPVKDREVLSLVSSTNRLWALCSGGAVLELNSQGQCEVLREYPSGTSRLSCLVVDIEAKQLWAGSFDGDLHSWEWEHPESHQQGHCLP